MLNNLLQGFSQGFQGTMGVGFGATTFQQTYRCRSVAFHKPEMERTGKICLPPSALEMLMRLSIQYPMLFEVMNPNTQQLTHCGVLEFTAEEGLCYMPYWMMQNLLIEEGSFIDVRNVTLPRGSFVKLQAHSKKFLEISNPKAVLEIQLRNYSCLTKGEVVVFYYLDEPYHMNVIEVKPSTYNAISIVETDLELDFLPPLDYVEPSAPVASSTTPSSSSSSSASAIGIGGKRITKRRSSAMDGVGSPPGSTAPFSTPGYRLDGKAVGQSSTTAPSSASSSSSIRPGTKTITKKVIRGGVLVEETVPLENASDSSSSEDSSEERLAAEEEKAAAAAAEQASGGKSFIAFSGKGRTLK